MKRLTVQAIHSQAPRRAAHEIVSGCFVEDPTLISGALHYWIQMHVIIIDEFEELLISPIRMIHEIEYKGRTYGDCDDVAMLAASILASCGAETQLVATFPQSDGSFAHVIVRYRFPGMENFVDFDGTMDDPESVYPEQVLIEDIIS